MDANTRMSEKAFMGNIIALAELTGWLVFHDYDSRLNNPGFPDLVLVRGGRIIIAECKTQKGRLRPMQVIWLEALRRCPSVETFLWRPSDWPQIVNHLKK